MGKTKNWITVTESSFPWERESLEFVRDQLPPNEPYRAWANFEFVAEDGSIYEVDLLVFTPQGIFLIEIKSRPGRLRGDIGTWTWETQGKPPATVDNPLFLANYKAKKLRSLLSRQKAAENKGGVPWIDAVVFCSAADLRLEPQRLRDRVGVKDGIPGLWLLIPGDSAAMSDGKTIPVISVTQRARIPESWLKNTHRGNLTGAIAKET